MPAKTILMFIAKPSHLSFGGNDTFAIQLARHWAMKEDRLIFAFNAANPCRDVFLSRLEDYAKIRMFDEPMTAERRMALAKRYPTRSWRLSFLEWWADLQRPFQAIACILRFRQLIKESQPDAVILNAGGNPPEDLGWRMMLAAWSVRVPKIILVNQSYPGKGTNLFRRIVLFVLRRMTRYFCDVLVTASEDMAAVFADSMKDRRPPTVIPYGIEDGSEYGTSLEEKRKILGLKPSLVVGMVGNAEERKGIHILISAMPALQREFPDLQLVLIGAPTNLEYAAQLERQIKALHLEEHITNMGPIPDAGQYFECFDVCVVPSTYAEAFGIVAIEALRYKKPVVATAAGGLKEVIVDGETGFLVPPSDASALAEAILKLLRSADLRKKMGNNGFARFNALYKTSTMAASYSKLVH